MYLKVKVTVSAKRESIKEEKKNYFSISVREKAERNMANARVIELVAEYYNVPKNGVHIVNGHSHPHKLLVVDDQ